MLAIGLIVLGSAMWACIIGVILLFNRGAELSRRRDALIWQPPEEEPDLGLLDAEFDDDVDDRL